MTWFCLNFAIFLAWWIFFARRYQSEFTLSERILAAFVTTIGQILLVIFITGWLHKLGWWETVVPNAVITLMVIILGQVSKEGNTFGHELDLLIIRIWRLLRSSSALWIIGILALFSAGWYLYLGQLLPPACWDAWGYHLTWAALAHQERFLGPFDFNNPYVNFFPKNTDILFLWSIIGAGTDRWANIVQGIFGLAGVLAVYRLARIAGARPRDAVASALLLLSVPVLIHMQWKAMVDLAIMGSDVLAIAFLARKRLTIASAVLAGVAAGFMVGSKGSAVYNYFALLLFLIYRCLPLGMNGFRHVKGHKFGTGLGVIIAFLMVSFAYGSYFYLRNWVLTGNPTGMYHVEFAGITFFEGTEETSVHFSRDLLSATLYDALNSGSEWPIVLDGFYDPQMDFSQGNRIGGWGAVWTVLLLPAIPFALIWALIRKKWRVIAIIAVCLLPYFLFKYNHTWLRYHLVVLAAGTVAFGYILSLLGRTRVRRLLLAAAGTLMAFTLFISGAQISITPVEISNARNHPYQLNNRYVSFDSWNDPVFARSLNLVKPAGTTLAVAGSPPAEKDLAFWNQYFTNRVVWIGWEDDGESWYRKIVDSGAGFVYVPKDSEPDIFALFSPLWFSLIFTSDNGSIYEIIYEKLKPDEE
ncbi:MAG: hypothetical protein NTY09_01075 [bacterium]|nr:hypothetical protein [bacterium]